MTQNGVKLTLTCNCHSLVALASRSASQIVLSTQSSYRETDNVHILLIKMCQLFCNLQCVSEFVDTVSITFMYDNITLACL